MKSIRNKDEMFSRYNIGLTKTKRGPARIHPNISNGDSGRVASPQEILLVAILDQLITLNETMADTYDLINLEIKSE